MQKKYFKLFANCIAVKGFNRSVVCDLQKGILYYIPNDLCKILISYEDMKFSEIKCLYNNKFDNIIKEYFEYLSSLNLGFFTNSPKSFPKMNMRWDSPFEISNSIVDINNFHFTHITNILNQLNHLHCKYIQIRFFKEVNFEDLVKFVSYLDNKESFIISVQLIIKYDTKISLIRIKSFLNKYSRVISIIIYASKENKLINVRGVKRGYVLYNKQKIINELSCGLVNETLFSTNIENFTESLKHNSCLNRKISIDTEGNIKNCPSMSQSFGNIKDTTLEEALNHKDFKKYWNITKDQIEVCKDCEFRYVCTDCRAYIEKPDDIYSKPLKCGYDPYTNIWKKWSTNPLKQKTIEYYGMQELVKKDV